MHDSFPLLERQASQETASVHGLVRNWNFVASPVPHLGRRQCVKIFFRNNHRSPAWLAIKPLVKKPQSWDLTGFTASSQLANHIQSYAFSLKSVDRARMLRLSPVMFPFNAISDANA
jgi:hypothetical protein